MKPSDIALTNVLERLKRRGLDVCAVEVGTYEKAPENQGALYVTELVGDRVVLTGPSQEPDGFVASWAVTDLTREGWQERVDAELPAQAG